MNLLYVDPLGILVLKKFPFSCNVNIYGNSVFRTAGICLGKIDDI